MRSRTLARSSSRSPWRRQVRIQTRSIHRHPINPFTAASRTDETVMHRATPLMTSTRAFVAGGARSVIAEVNDKPLMQEMKGNFMKGETRQEVESPQNYGFTSVCMDGDKGKDGRVE